MPGRGVPVCRLLCAAEPPSQDRTRVAAHVLIDDFCLGFHRIPASKTVHGVGNPMPVLYGFHPAFLRTPVPGSALSMPIFLDLASGWFLVFSSLAHFANPFLHFLLLMLGFHPATSWIAGPGNATSMPIFPDLASGWFPAFPSCVRFANLFLSLLFSMLGFHPATSWTTGPGKATSMPLLLDLAPGWFPAFPSSVRSANLHLYLFFSLG